MSTASKNWSNDERPRIVVLFGPTAVGKTDVLFRLSLSDIEVINADSRQVYRALNIGTAKPGAETRREVPHHLVDICDPAEQYTAGRFVHDADRLSREISERGGVPVVCGGTAYYIRSFLYGLPDTPPVFPEIRTALKHTSETGGLAKLFAELRTVDPGTADRIAPNDRYRIERALEVYRGTGQPLSSFSVPRNLRDLYRYVLIGLERPRVDLYRRIDDRVESMFTHGLMREVAGLLESGYRGNEPGLTTIGYREILDMRKRGCLTVDGARELIKRNSRRYAKRQITFFSSFPGVRWFHPDDIDAMRTCVRNSTG